MNRKEFLEELESRLIGVSKEDKKEILQDYEEHFKIGKKKKRAEEEISKSLGEPKKVAEEIRKELSGRREGTELKTEAIETWVSLKKFSRHIFNEMKQKIDELSRSFDSKKISHWIWAALVFVLFLAFISIFWGGFVFLLIFLVLILLVAEFWEKKDRRKRGIKKKGVKNNAKRNALGTILLLFFNFFIFLWVWIGALLLIFSFYVLGVSLMIAGLFLGVFAIFSLINYSSSLLSDLFLSSLFAGVGLSILGVLIMVLFDRVLRIFFKFTKKYLKFNQRVFGK